MNNILYIVYCVSCWIMAFVGLFLALSGFQNWKYNRTIIGIPIGIFGTGIMLVFMFLIVTWGV